MLRTSLYSSPCLSFSNTVQSGASEAAGLKSAVGWTENLNPEPVLSTDALGEVTVYWGGPVNSVPAVLNSSMSKPGDIMDGIGGIPAPPNILDPEEVVVEELLDDMTEDDEKEEDELDIILDPELNMDERPPDGMLIISPPPPTFMPSIIFFIMSSISRLIWPPGSPPDEVEVIVDEDMLEEENVEDELKLPSSLLVEVAIIC